MYANRSDLTARPAESVANWLDITFDALYERLEWGGTMIVGGPVIDGQPVHYM